LPTDDEIEAILDSTDPAEKNFNILKAREMCEGFGNLPDSEITPEIAVKMIKVGALLERLAMGVPTKIVRRI